MSISRRMDHNSELRAIHQHGVPSQVTQSATGVLSHDHNHRVTTVLFHSQLGMLLLQLALEPCNSPSFSMQDHQVNGLDVMLYYWDESQTQLPNLSAPTPSFLKLHPELKTTLTRLTFRGEAAGGGFRELCVLPCLKGPSIYCKTRTSVRGKDSKGTKQKPEA